MASSQTSVYKKYSTVPSEESLDEAIPSFPGSPRELSVTVTQQQQVPLSVRLPDIKQDSLEEIGEYERNYQITAALLKEQEFLVAAEAGNANLLKTLIGEGVNVHQTDLFGRNALHLAVHSGNDEAILVALSAGIKPTTKDDIGMTPLSICLMRRPKARIAELLFQYGAKILPRASPMDTGIFIQFVMMCTPTSEDEKILRLLVEHGALVDDPGAPGQRQALHFAAMSDNCALIRILTDLGANPCALNHQKKTPLEVAMIYKCYDAVECLTQIERERGKLDETVSLDESSGSNETVNPDKTLGLNQTANPDKTLGLNQTANPNETLGLNQTANPNETLGLTETANPDKTLGLTETENPDKTLGLTETANPDKTSGPNENENPDKTLDLNKTTNPDKTLDLNETANPDKTLGQNKTANPNETSGSNVLLESHETTTSYRSIDAISEYIQRNQIAVDDETNFRIIQTVRSDTTTSDNSQRPEERSNKKN